MNDISSKKDIKDVFHAYLVEDANYIGYYEMPKVDFDEIVPTKLISFTKALYKDEFESVVHFYQDDYKFEKLWNKPCKYIDRLKKFKGVISPDFSMYRDMPLSMQIWNNYRNRALSYYLKKNGIKVIPNVRFSDERTYGFCFDGITKNSIIAIGALGNIQNVENREYFKKGLKEMVRRLTPRTIIAYGAAPDKIFKEYKEMGIKIIPFESEISLSRKGGSV